jgi:hypothetical protein
MVRRSQALQHSIFCCTSQNITFLRREILGGLRQAPLPSVDGAYWNHFLQKNERQIPGPAGHAAEI